MKRQLISCDDKEAVLATRQHTKPCSDCPLSRGSLPGWLGSDDPQTWLRMLHGETRIECHTLLGAQCAGAAIYRANVAKLVHDRSQLWLSQDTKAVFANPAEFLKHHEGKP